MMIDDSGSLLTYHIWSCIDNDWKQFHSVLRLWGSPLRPSVFFTCLPMYSEHFFLWGKRVGKTNFVFETSLESLYVHSCFSGDEFKSKRSYILYAKVIINLNIQHGFHGHAQNEAPKFRKEEKSHTHTHICRTNEIKVDNVYIVSKIW